MLSFPFHQNKDPSFLYNPLISQKQDIADHQDLILGQLYHLARSRLLPTTMSRGKKHIKMPSSENKNEETSVCDDEKKIIRRETERKRRLQMTSLCKSLKSLLPFELIKVFPIIPSNLNFSLCFSINFHFCGITHKKPNFNLGKAFSV